MPEVDMSEVMSYLRCGQQSVDAELILPQERAEILARSAALADAGSQGAGKVSGRVLQQAAAALPLYDYGALSRSGLLELQVRTTSKDAEGPPTRFATTK